MTQQSSPQTASLPPVKAAWAFVAGVEAGSGTELLELAKAGVEDFELTKGVVFVQVTPSALQASLRSHDRLGVDRVLHATKYTCNTP